MEVVLTKVSLKLSFLTTKIQKLLACVPKLFIRREPWEQIPAAEVKRRKSLVAHSAECTFYGKLTVNCLTCDRHLLAV